MKFMYFFDDKIKRHIMRGKKYCNPAETGKYDFGISCIRQHDVNIWFYSKNGTTIAVDSGHLNFSDTVKAFKSIGVEPDNIKYVFITHADVDHCGGIDVCGTNIFPKAQVYIGKDEKAYLNGTTHRITKLDVKLKNCVKLADGYYAVNDNETFDIDGIKIRAIHTPGHTLGHTCYIFDEKVLFTGDCLAVNDNGGYSFFDFFTQYPELNKKSLQKLKIIVNEFPIEYVCTGHSGIRKYSESIFAHIDKSTVYSRKKRLMKKHLMMFLININTRSQL